MVREIWLQHGGSDGMDIVTDLATDEWGNSIISVYSSQQSVSGLIFNTDTIPQWHGGIVKYDPSGNLLYTQKLQEARSLQALALGNDSVFYGTGNGFNPGLPYINLSIPQCEDTVNGYYNPPYKMIMVKFLDNSSVHTAVIETNEDIIQDLIVYPNPFSSITTLALHLSKASHTSIIILDVVGRTVKNVSANNLQAGENKITIDLSELNSGIYFCHINSNASLIPLNS
ncbi:MAG: T9SS type A sorting domain-containing protein [Bacteroidetes bacterium]|nr:T9SS type A sorting domain-containing protein [Bacteroidota bacterium]